MWRGPEFAGDAPAEGRVEAFRTACAMHAGRRERDLMTIVEGFGQELEKKAAQRGPGRGVR